MVSGRTCMGSGQPFAWTRPDGSRYWQTEGASSKNWKNYLILLEMAPRSKLWTHNWPNPCSSNWSGKPKQLGEYADFHSPGSVPARVVDDPDGRPNPRSDPLCADRA